MSKEENPQQRIIPVEAQRPLIDILKLVVQVTLDPSPETLQAAVFIGQGIIRSLEDKPEVQREILEQIQNMKTRLSDSSINQSF